MKRFLLGICFFFTFGASFSLFADDAAKKVYAHLLLEDFSGAYKEARAAWKKDPLSEDRIATYIQALSAIGDDRVALNLLQENIESLKDKREVLESVAWSILKKGQSSTQYGVRLVSLVGAHMTNDAKAVKILLHSMKDQNAVIRAIAVHLASSFHDLPFQKAIEKMFDNEKIWFVRLELIKAAGMMRMKSLTAPLLEIAASEMVTYEERALAVESLVKIYDRIQLHELQDLANSPSGGIRFFVCDLVSHLKMKEAKQIVFSLLKDPIADVRVKALNTIALVFLPSDDEEYLKCVEQALHDPHPEVAITASWVATRSFPQLIGKQWEKWILQKDEDYARFAAAALAASGKNGVRIASLLVDKARDSFVKMNLALGLIGQREQVKKSCDILVEGLSNDQKWMWDSSHNDLFSVLSPSRIRHVNHIPHYPEAVDQMTRLHLLSFLSVVEDKRAEEAIRGFLEKKRWGISGFAAATLLREGNESSLEAIKKLLEDSNTKVRVQAALVMAFLGKDPSVIPILIEAYAQSDHEMKGYILEAMGHMGTLENVKFFIESMQESSQILRVIAASSFLQSLNR